MSSKENIRSRGFTLIEVLISLLILSFLSYFTYQSIKRGVNFKNKVQENIDQRTALNNAVKIIERDVNLAFHYQDFHYDLDQQVEKAKYDAQVKAAQDAAQKSGTQPAPQPPFQSKLKKPPNYTNFIGETESITFTNLNHFKLSEDSHEGDQQVVSYSLKTCKKLVNKSLNSKNSTNCLWRRTNPYIDSDITQNGEEIVLLEGVTELKFRYFGKPKTEWINTWYTNERGDVETQNNFPQAAEVTLATNWNEKKMSAIRVIPLRFPNNKDAPPPGQPGQPGQPPLPPPKTGGP